MAERMEKAVTYREAVDMLAVAELEVVGEARRLDPNGLDRDLLGKTSALVEAMETYVSILFDVDGDDLKDDVGQVDRNVIQNYFQKRAMMAAECQTERQG